MSDGSRGIAHDVYEWVNVANVALCRFRTLCQ